MTRTIDELVAALFDVVPPGTVLLILLLGTALTSALWYFYPAWIPRRWPRWRWKRRKKRDKSEKSPTVSAPAEPDEPDDEQPADDVDDKPFAPVLAADRLAAEGRYAEAIRQRLRDTVHDLIHAGVLSPQPGWTAAELAALAADRRPAIAAPFGAATELFAEVWYGDRPAGRDQDDRMRAMTDHVRREVLHR